MSDINNAAVSLYLSGLSVGDVAGKIGLPKSSARKIISDAGIMRTRSDGLKLANTNGRGAAKLRGRKRTYTSDVHRRIVEAAVASRRAKAKGTRVNSNGYHEFTMGPDAGRNVHAVKMEKRIGRRLKPDECVHHIDGNKLNNEENNLALLTISGHARLHRLQDALSGGKRERNENGRFC